MYFDRGVFSSSHPDIGFDTPLGHPSLPRPFGVDAKTPQDVSDVVFNITRGNNGNRERVPHLMMTFGQFLDHDFALSLHQDACSNRYGIATEYSNVIDSNCRQNGIKCSVTIFVLSNFFFKTVD